jgi:aldose 1-epimerase
MKVKLMLAAATVAMSNPAMAATAHVASFGHLPDGREVKAVTLSNGHGVSATIISFGATLQSVILPDRNGKLADVALGFATLDGYLGKRQFFGGTVGRYANRIARGRFPLDGKSVQVVTNEGVNALHGGPEGFDRVLWDVAAVRNGPLAAVTLRYVSRDGDQGYPGTVTVDATYSLDERDQLQIEYKATTDKPTLVNISNHAYWNLSGEGAARGAMGHRLTIPADAYLPTDAASIPTGEIRSVTGTPFDFRAAHMVGERVRDATDAQIVIGRGYDHNFVVGRAVTPDEHLMARVEDPESGRSFELWSNQPGLQFYSGNFLDATTIGKARRLYRIGDAIVLEPQLFPDTPNEPSFGSAILRPGNVYRNVMTYRFKISQTSSR